MARRDVEAVRHVVGEAGAYLLEVALQGSPELQARTKAGLPRVIERRLVQLVASELAPLPVRLAALGGLHALDRRSERWAAARLIADLASFDSLRHERALDRSDPVAQVAVGAALDILRSRAVMDVVELPQRYAVEERYDGSPLAWHETNRRLAVGRLDQEALASTWWWLRDLAENEPQLDTVFEDEWFEDDGLLSRVADFLFEHTRAEPGESSLPGASWQGVIMAQPGGEAPVTVEVAPSGMIDTPVMSDDEAPTERAEVPTDQQVGPASGCSMASAPFVCDLDGQDRFVIGSVVLSYGDGTARREPKFGQEVAKVFVALLRRASGEHTIVEPDTKGPYKTYAKTMFKRGGVTLVRPRGAAPHLTPPVRIGPRLRKALSKQNRSRNDPA